MDTEQFEVPCTWFNIRRASRAVTQHFDQILQPIGLRVTQLSILYSLKVAGPSKITEIADQLVLDRTTLTRNIRPLEKLGLVKTGKGNDKRMRILKLTKKGNDLIETALPLWKKANSHFICGLGLPNWNEFMAHLSSTVKLAR